MRLCRAGSFPEFREPLPLLDELHLDVFLVKLQEKREGEGELPERQDQREHLIKKALSCAVSASAARRRQAATGSAHSISERFRSSTPYLSGSIHQNMGMTTKYPTTNMAPTMNREGVLLYVAGLDLP